MLKRSALLVLIFILSFSIIGAYGAQETIPMYSEGAAPDGSRFRNTDAGVLAARLDVKGGKFVGLHIPSWYITPTSTTIILYKWDTDYETTIKSPVLYSDSLDDYVNEGWQDPGDADFIVDFERAFSEGKYLLVYKKNMKHALHIPTHPTHADSLAYVNGEVQEDISYRVSAIIDKDATLNEEPNVKVNVFAQQYAIYGEGASLDGESYIPISYFDVVGQKFTANQQGLAGLVINELYVGSGYADIDLTLYKWKGTYADTVKEAPLYYDTYEAETEGVGIYQDFLMQFGDRVYDKGDYLVLLSSYDDVNLWAHNLRDGVTSFMDGDVYEEGTYKMSYWVIEGAKLNEEPYIKETPQPTDEPTKAPETEETPKPTGIIKDNTKDDKDKESSKLGLYIGLGVLLVVVIAIVVFVIIKRKKG